jgi:hypothetical protein
MARKPKGKDKDKGQHIDRLREKAGVASDRWNWTNKTGRSFREKGQEGQRHPRQRPADISK